MRYLLPALLVVLFGCASGRDGSPPDLQPTLPQRRILSSGAQRLYQLHVPTGTAQDEALPVVFAFHGAGSSIASLVRASGLNALADRESFAVVYPQGVGGRFDTSRGSRDVIFVRDILRDLEGTIRVDRHSVHATGFSNGAMLCYRLASDLPDVFAAIAPVAGLLASDALPRGRMRVSLLHVHGTADRVVPSMGRSGSYAVANGVATWASRAGCNARPTIARVTGAAPLRVEHRRYHCPDGVEVGLLWIEGKGHTWPGEANGWLTRTIWQFFRAHPRP